MLVQHYDISSRELEGFGLEEIERHFRLVHPGRTYIEPERVSDLIASEPAALRDATLDNARQVAKLAEILSLSYFVQAQIFPYSYQNVILRGNATKIDSLLLRAYLARATRAVSRTADRARRRIHRVRRLGVAHQVLHCDVTSLYPSLMIQFGLGPSSDRLGIFVKMLADLRTFRVQAKSRPARIARCRAALFGSAAADFQDSDQFVLWISRLFARPFQRFRAGGESPAAAAT